MAQVLKVIKNEEDEVVQWKVSWYGPFGGGAEAVFSYLHRTETIDVDIETLVAVTPKLNANNKLPSQVIKDAITAVKAVEVAEANGNACCTVCTEDKGDDLVECGCCSKYFHTSCARGYNTSLHHAWWCPACSPRT